MVAFVPGIKVPTAVIASGRVGAASPMALVAAKQSSFLKNKDRIFVLLDCFGASKARGDAVAFLRLAMTAVGLYGDRA